MMLGAVAAFVLSFAAVPFQSADAAAFHQGESGPEVAAIQEKLLMEGYDIGIPDGVYGERTVDAIKKYQASMGLEVDGIIGDSTYMKLHGKTDAPVCRIWSKPRAFLSWQRGSEKVDLPSL